MPSIRNLFLVRGFVRLRADEILSPRGKVPKGRRGRPKGACGMAAPGPPVAKKQCTASLAGARQAGFTSVPGRATVAFKVGFHFVKAKSLRDPRIRLWRKRGLAQLIPPPAFGRRSIPGVMARGRYGKTTLQRYTPRLRCHAKCVPDTVSVGRVTRERARCGARGHRGKSEFPLPPGQRERNVSQLELHPFSRRRGSFYAHVGAGNFEKDTATAPARRNHRPGVSAPSYTCGVSTATWGWQDRSCAVTRNRGMGGGTS